MNSAATELNPGQQQAITQTEGPLLIIAGAGTGKTKVITSRILYLLQEKKIPPSQILALTFTEKATAEMIERVDIALPLSYEEMAIKTFHGFCDQVLRERGMEIGIDPGYKILTQAEQWLFFKKNLFNFKLEYYRPLGNPGKFIFTLLSHFSRLKDEDIKPDDYVECAQKLSKEAKDDAEKEEAAKMLEVAEAYKTYMELCAQNNFLDFGDLQFYCLRLFEKRASVLKEFRNRYKYIMVDEFQDTNFAQNKLVIMLATEHKNLAVVGDDDQSIYKWRGASLNNILNFEKVFPEAKKVVLTENYRSTQNILDLSYGLIQNNNPHRLEAAEGLNKKLRSQKGAGAPAELWHFGSYLEEARAVAEKIRELAEGGVGGEGGYRDSAILVRTNQHARIYAQELKDMGIPFTIRDTQGLLNFEEIKDLLSFLKFVTKPHDDIAFFRLLSLPIFSIPVQSILDLQQKAKDADYKPMFFYLREWLKKSDQNSLPGLNEDQNLFEPIYDFFDALLNFTRENGVARIIGEFLDKSGYYKNLTAQDSAANADKIQHIAQLIELARNFENESGENSVWSFLDYLEMMDEAQGVIPAASQNEEDAVSILTVHSSKGLEFKNVFIPTLVAQRFPATNRKDPIDIPEELLNESLPADEFHIPEERRLFYVACTRAKENLFLSYSDRYEGAKKWKPSPFIAEVLQSGSAVSEKDFTTSQTAEENTGRKHSGLTAQQSEHEKKLFYVPAVNVNQLSYSKLDTFQACPLKYKFRYLFNIPSPSAHAANFGSSVHNTVNEFYASIKDGAEPSQKLLNDLYEKNWIGAGYDSKAHEQARKKKGLETMENFYTAEEKAGFKAPAYQEKAFSLKIGKIRFSGRIDRIDRLPDGTYEVVDYKTGSYKKDANLDKDLQLSLYALACRDVYKIPVSALSLYFLEDARKVSTTRTQEQLSAVEEEITQISDELKASTFQPTPGFHCGFCEYRLLCNAAQ